MEKLKVLYAEDDPLTVMEVAEQLEERGFEVIVATNGTEALKLFRERQPNVVLLDVDMPGHNGFEVLQIIRLTDHYTPIVIYSSLGDEANQMRGLESGAYSLKSLFIMAEMVLSYRSFPSRHDRSFYAKTGEKSL